ncbi:putative odorant receptor 83c [Anopheles merus]|uniref:Odorant receptor n=1 Tax=Anopheles merus TaxID=30066 RepID=A0A182VK60_ANOME|nr:putative odorant receptor 83c [Anopheles merus]
MAVGSESPIERFDRILSWQCHILRMLGMDGYGRRLEHSKLSATVMLMAGLFMAISFYDVLVLFRDDLFGKSFVLSTICFGCIGWGRILGGFSHRDDLPRLMRTARDTYLRANPHDARQSALLRWYTDIFWHGVMLYTILFLFGAGIASVGPGLLYLYNGERILPFGVYLPFLDPDSTSGYELNYLYQLSCILWTPPGLTATQNIYFALILNICIQYDVLELHLADLDALVKRPDAHGRDRLVRQKLHEIILDQTRLEEFVQLIERVYSPQAIVEVLSLTFQLVMTLYVMRTSIWLPGLFLIPLCTIQLLVFCIPGTLIELKASKLTESIYATAWHEMHQQNKQLIHLLLHRSQHPRGLTCAGMVSINMNLFLNVAKKVYSIFMMMESM